VYLPREFVVVLLLLCAITLSACVSPATERVLARNENARSDRLVESYDDAGVFVEIEQFDHLIESMLQSLYPAAHNDYQIKLARVAEDNAYALPTNVIIIHLGLLATMQSADQLAFVVAHELAHIHSGHSYISAQQRRRSRIKAQLGDIISFGSGKSFVHYASKLRASSREQELEADRIAAEKIQKAGFDLAKAERFFEQIKLHTKIANKDKTSTHPALESRRELISHLRRTSADAVAPASNSAQTHDQFNAMLKVVLPLVIEDKIAASDFHSAIRHVNALAKLDGESSVTRCLRGDLFSALALNNPHLFVPSIARAQAKSDSVRLPLVYEEKAARDHFAKLALQEYKHITSVQYDDEVRSSIGVMSAFGCAQRGMGINHHTLGQYERSREFLMQYLDHKPAAVDARFIERLLSAN